MTIFDVKTELNHWKLWWRNIDTVKCHSSLGNCYRRRSVEFKYTFYVFISKRFCLSNYYQRKLFIFITFLNYENHSTKMSDWIPQSVLKSSTDHMKTENRAFQNWIRIMLSFQIRWWFYIFVTKSTIISVQFINYLNFLIFLSNFQAH